MRKKPLVIATLCGVLLFLIWPLIPGITFIAVSFIFKEPHTFEWSGHAVANEVREVLVEDGNCRTVDSCTDSIFIRQLRDGYVGYVYGITASSTLTKIESVFAKEFLNNKELKRLSIEAYAFPKKNEEYFFTFPRAVSKTKWKEGAILEVEMRRD